MSAIACLRVDVTAQGGSMPLSTLAPLVQKFASAYLETRWLWPRRFYPLSEFNFLLTDPRSDELDVGELRRLSDNLQTHLFGVGDEGEVALLVFEGAQAAVTAFAAMDARAVALAVVDPSLLPPGGRLTRIVADRLAEPEPEPQPARGAVEYAPLDGPALRRVLTEPQPPPAPVWEGVQGVYLTLREVFYAEVVMYIPENAKTHLSIVDGPEHMPKDPAAFDAACVGVAANILAQRSKGLLLFLPICFTSLVRPSLRHAYEAMLSELPPERRGELAAMIYDVPRDPNFTGLREARAMLEPYFSHIDLRVADPGFEVEKLPPGAATSVTLMLPDGDAHQRLSALRRFGERREHYKQRRIWTGLTNVRRRAEVSAAAGLRIPFLTGPGVCTPLPTSPVGRSMSIAGLPLSLREHAFPNSGGATSEFRSA